MEAIWIAVVRLTPNICSPPRHWLKVTQCFPSFSDAHPAGMSAASDVDLKVVIVGT